jgi:hemerythrin-like domain-containing protein
VPVEIFEKFTYFIKNFIDICHHGKEEKVLFPLIEKYGFPREGGPTGVMLLEHEQGRTLAKVLADAVERYKKGEEAAKRVIIESSQAYILLLTQHIPKEDEILYPLADRILSADEKRDLLKGFREVEEYTVGPGKHEELLNYVDELEMEAAKF